MIKTELYPYQKLPVEHSKKFYQEHGVFRGGLLYKPGRGKTLTSLAIFDGLVSCGYFDSLIIIAPKSVLATWEAQIARHCEFQRSVMIRWSSEKSGTQKYRQELENCLQSVTPVFIVNVEAFQSDNAKLSEVFSDLAKRNVFLILDESTRIKTHNSARTKSLIKKAEGINGKLILTGTPMPKSIVDMWSQFEFLKKNFWKERSYYIFEKTYLVKVKQRIAEGREIDRVATFADVHEMRSKIELMNKHPNGNRGLIARLEYEADNLEQRLNYAKSLEVNVFNQIKDIVFYADRPEGLPETIDTMIMVELSSDEKRVYKEFKNELLTTLASGEILSVKNRASLLHKYRQISLGHIDSEHSIIEGTSSKLKALIDDIDDHDEPAIILSSYVRDIEMICKALQEYGGAVMHYGEIPLKQRELNVERAIAGEVRFIVANPSTIGTGVDGIQRRFNLMYFMTTPIKSEEWIQTRGRIDRDGQKNVCVYKHLIAKNTADERCMELIQQKLDLQERFDNMSLEEFRDTF